DTSMRCRTLPTSRLGIDPSPPATFALILYVIAPRLKFDAWATHPYPTTYILGPAQRVAYPNVAFTTMTRFGADLAKWFHRPIPIWITEYGEQTKPEYPFGGVTYAKQAADAAKALQLASENKYVEMFVWFIFRDSNGAPWFSGLLKKNGTKKPSYNSFMKAAVGVVGQSQVVAPAKTFKVVLPVPVMAYYNPVGTKVGLTWAVKQGKKNLAISQPL